MKIGILGTGDVGRALGHAFIKTGSDVKIGSRNPTQDKVQRWVAENGEHASGGTFEEAAKFGELIVLATLWTATEQIIEMAQEENFKNKVVIDTTNPLDFSRGVPPRLSLSGNTSSGEKVQEWLPEAHVVKCFNLVGNAFMFHPQFEEGEPTMFIAGNNDDAKRHVTDILHEFGWNDVVDMGKIEESRLLEALAMVWIRYGAKYQHWNHAFKLLKK
jgi:predicted dinucleotide-binding enzyme